MRALTNRRGSTFFRCGRADTDARFVRYPPLPVLTCPGYERLGDPGEQGAGSGTGR